MTSAIACIIGGIIGSTDGVAEIVGGAEDHIHILAGLHVHSIPDLMREVKSISSQWVHKEIGLRMFAWQEGYAGITVSPSQREVVRRYIEAQEEHHRARTFQEEYLDFLTKSGIEFDPRFL